MSTLEVKSLTKRFGSLVAVRDVSMTVAKGELRAVIGPNGAGKTTFFNLVSGFFAPTSGSILFEGRDVAGFSAHERVGMGMARTFQITEIFPELTVFENVRIAAEVAAGYRLRPWLSRADTAERAPARRGDAGAGRAYRQSQQACRRIGARRPARRRDRDGARAQAAPPSAR